jgi:hypothetical protein
MVAIQALVAAGTGPATVPGLALDAHRHPDVVATEIPGAQRHEAHCDSKVPTLSVKMDNGLHQ